MMHGIFGCPIGHSTGSFDVGSSSSGAWVPSLVSAQPEKTGSENASLSFYLEPDEHVYSITWLKLHICGFYPDLLSAGSRKSTHTIQRQRRTSNYTHTQIYKRGGSPTRVICIEKPGFSEVTFCDCLLPSAQCLCIVDIIVLVVFHMCLCARA